MLTSAEESSVHTLSLATRSSSGTEQARFPPQHPDMRTAERAIAPDNPKYFISIKFFVCNILNLKQKEKIMTIFTLWTNFAARRFS